jgi:hypothetical protein
MTKYTLFLFFLAGNLLTAIAQTNKIESTGNVVIGTLNPGYKLDVKKNSLAPAISVSGGYSGSPRLQLYGLDADPNAWMGFGSDMGGGPYEHSIYFPTAPTGYNISRLTIGDYNGAVYNVRFSVLNNGNVGIGTQFPTDKLSVFGNIRATEVKVENGNWPDYVFDPLYVPTGLSDLEKISEYKHLPEILTADEIENEGIKLGDMNPRLLKKVEELTLYLIENQKELQSLKLKVNQLSDQLNSNTKQ